MRAARQILRRNLIAIAMANWPPCAQNQLMTPQERGIDPTEAAAEQSRAAPRSAAPDTPEQRLTAAQNECASRHLPAMTRMIRRGEPAGGWPEQAALWTKINLHPVADQHAYDRLAQSPARPSVRPGNIGADFPREAARICGRLAWFVTTWAQLMMYQRTVSSNHHGNTPSTRTTNLDDPKMPATLPRRTLSGSR